MTGKELFDLYNLQVRHREWSKVDALIVQLSSELDKPTDKGFMPYEAGPWTPNTGVLSREKIEAAIQRAWDEHGATEKASD